MLDNSNTTSPTVYIGACFFGTCQQLLAKCVILVFEIKCEENNNKQSP